MTDATAATEMMAEDHASLPQKCNDVLFSIFNHMFTCTFIVCVFLLMDTHSTIPWRCPMDNFDMHDVHPDDVCQHTDNVAAQIINSQVITRVNYGLRVLFVTVLRTMHIMGEAFCARALNMTFEEMNKPPHRCCAQLTASNFIPCLP